MEQVPKELIHMALDDIILKNQFPDVIKDLEKIAKARKISIYKVMEYIVNDMTKKGFYKF